MDFHSVIRENLYKFNGIVDNSDRVESINILLNEVNDRGFVGLVNKFCSQEEPDQAYDLLFEIWVCRSLLRNPEIKNLQYEPSDADYPPDFHFTLANTCFDIQIKRLQNIRNEIIKDLFHHECRKRLKGISKAWFINYGISQNFDRTHINHFFQYIKDRLNTFTALPSLHEVIKKPEMYCWPDEGNKLVTFSFSEKTKKENNFISIGTIFDGVDGISVSRVDMEPIRRSIKRILRKSRPTLNKEISPTQSNLVIMKTGSELWLDKEDMLNVLYGDEGVQVSMRDDGTEDMREVRSKNGLFRADTFSTICGLIFIPHNVTILDQELKGVYFPHLTHSDYIRTHPKPFPQLPFCYPTCSL